MQLRTLNAGVNAPRGGRAELSVSVMGLGLAIDTDKALLFSAAGNLLQNVFKFTKPVPIDPAL